MESSKNLALLLESAPVAIVTVDRNGTVLYTNARLNEMFGYDRGELLGQAVETLIPERFRELHAHHRQSYVEQPHIRPMGTGMDLAGRRRDGSEFPIEAGLSLIQIGDTVLIMGSITDISRRKQTEDLLETRVRERTAELERKRKVSDGLRDTLAILNSNRAVDEILSHIVEQATLLLFADAAAVYSLEDGEPSPVLKAHHGITEEQIRLAAALIPDDEQLDQALEYRVSRSPAAGDERSATSSGDAESKQVQLTTVERLRANPSGHLLLEVGYQAMLSVPLLVKDAIDGNLMLYYREPRTFSAEEIELATMVGDQAALAIENARLRAQAERSAVTAERNRIARDLHDSVTQTLFSATVIAEVLPRIWERDRNESERRLVELRQLTRGALAEMRTLLLELRPATLSEVELDELMRQLTESASGRARLPIELRVDSGCTLPSDVKIAVYHIAQEALNNIAKHARASCGELTLECRDDELTLQVNDDGRGFVLDHVTAEHLGLTIMRERAEGIGARLEIVSTVGQGTRVRLHWTAAVN